jgi:hypothetical protein
MFLGMTSHERKVMELNGLGIVRSCELPSQRYYTYLSNCDSAVKPDTRRQQFQWPELEGTFDGRMR